MEFGREVRQEISRVTWPTRKETVVTTILVFIMVFICATYFLLVDQVLSTVVKYVLGMWG
ncbi:preprotein translocase subunit SecE [Candidatus Bealeia paramacronuclearis]